MDIFFNLFKLFIENFKKNAFYTVSIFFLIGIIGVLYFKIDKKVTALENNIKSKQEQQKNFNNDLTSQFNDAKDYIRLNNKSINDLLVVSSNFELLINRNNNMILNNSKKDKKYFDNVKNTTNNNKPKFSVLWGLFKFE